MTPASLFTMILNHATAPTIGAFNLIVNWPLYLDFNESTFGIQINVGNKPGRN